MKPFDDKKKIAPSPMTTDEGRNDLYMYSLKKMADRNSEVEKISLTGLYGTAPFFYKANECMIQYPNLNYALIRMDIYRFKTVNEFYGREIGDKILRYIADCFRVYEHETTVIGHLRSDIFQLLTPYETDEDLVNIVNEINGKIEQLDVQCKILPAFGICKQDMNMDIALLSDYANLALQTVKGKVFSCYAFYDEKMRQDLLYEKKIENDILVALKEKHLQIYIQPKVNMRTKEIVGGEALIRWLHPIDGMISPGSFIPILERSGYIIEVDHYVWEQIFASLKKQMDQQHPVLPISINVSRLHAFRTNFEEILMDLSRKYQVDPSMVILEVTESSFAENADLLYSKLHRLQNLGFQISMDDFGSEYSSMNMLKDEPVDEIKIDRIFLSDITSKKSRTIIKTIISLMVELDMHLVAEGVETKEQADYLLECGCEICQGYLFYRPMPADEFFELIRSK